MKMTKYLLLLLLCTTVGATSTLFAQSDKVLVAGQPQLRRSDVNSLIDFYEWAFEAKFTEQQRIEFERFTIKEFRDDPATSRKSIDQIIAAAPRLRSSSAEAQKQAREAFLPDFLSLARKNTDTNSRMLLEIYESAHVGGRTETAQTEAAVDQTDGPTGNVAALSGKWVWAHSGSSTYSTGGSYMGSNGSRFTYTFDARGGVDYTGIMNVMTGGCTMQVFQSRHGQARISGDKLSINWSPGTFSRNDTCSPSKDYKKTVPAETETFKVKFKDDLGQRQLCMTGKDETCYSPAS